MTLGLGRDALVRIPTNQRFELEPEALHAAIAAAWGARDDRYSELRGLSTVDLPKPEMSYLGG